MKNKHTDYEAFVKKFEPLKTTDDCYTPTGIFEVVEQQVRERYKNIEKLETIRPFKPGGDYIKEDYKNKVVIDNPPFSILSEIVNYYKKNNIKYFLFAPHNVIMNIDAQLVLTGIIITYHNGAKVNTSFLTNLSDCKIEYAADLSRELRNVERENQKKKKRTKYKYPENFIHCVSGYDIATYKNNIKIYEDEVQFIRKINGSTIYGGGYALNAKALKRIKETEKIEITEPIVELDYSEEQKEQLKKRGIYNDNN